MGIWEAVNRVTNRVTNDVFAVTSVIYRPHDAGEFEIRCPYWSEFIEADPGTGLPVKSNNPRLRVVLCDLRGHEPSNRDRWEVAGEEWAVDHVDPNRAEGDAWIYLRKLRGH